MITLTEAQVVEEIHLAQGAKTCKQILAASAPSAGHCHVCAIKLNSTVVLADVGRSFNARQSFNTPGNQRSGVSGVSLSPDGTYIAAFSADELYVARVYSLDRVGQLRHVAQLAGIKAVHWCPGSTALAVCCKQQVDIYLLVLPPWSPSSDSPSSTQPALSLAPLQRLRGPRSASTGPRCAAWLPRCDNGSPAALLAAWSSDLLMYTWAPSGLGVDWGRHKAHRFLAGWPGPVRALATAPSLTNKDSSLVLATVDAQLELGRTNSDNSSVSSSQLEVDVGQLLHPAGAGGSSSSSTCSNVCRAGKGSGLIIELHADAGSGAGSHKPAAPTPTPAIAANGIKMQADVRGRVSPYPDVDITDTPRLLPQQDKLTAAASTGSLLSSLMNIPAHSNGAGDGKGSSCLCLLEVNVSDIVDSSNSSASSVSSTNTTNTTGSSSSKNSSRCEASIAGNLPSAYHSQQHPRTSHKSATQHAQSTPFRSMLQLPHLPLPDLLSVYNGIVAIGSSKGQPLVTLCSFGSQKQGLQLLQTVAVPLPSPLVQDSASLKARLESLLLTPSVQQHQSELSRAGSAGGTRYPKIQEGGWPGVLDDEGDVWHSEHDSHSDGPSLPDVVGLLHCCEVQQTGGFASFGTTAAEKGSDMFLMKCRAPPEQKQLQAAQHSEAKQVAQSEYEQERWVQELDGNDEMVPLRIRMSCNGSSTMTAAAGAATARAADGSMWWDSAEQHAALLKQAQQQEFLKQQQHKQLAQSQLELQQKLQQGEAEPKPKPQLSKAMQKFAELKQQEQTHLEQRQRELKHQSVVMAVGRSVSVETIGSCVSTCTWTSTTDDVQQQLLLQSQQDQKRHAVAAADKPSRGQFDEQQPHTSQLHQKQLEQHDKEFQAAVTRVNKVVAVLSGMQSRLEQAHVEVVSGSLPGCSGLGPGRSGTPYCSQAGSSLPRLQLPEPQEELAPGGLGTSVCIESSPSSLGQPERHSEAQCGVQAGSSSASAGPERLDRSAADQGGATENEGVTAVEQEQLLIERVNTIAAAASTAAVGRIQANFEQRLDALLQLQEQQQQLLQQQQEDLRQHQQLMLQRAERETALYEVIASMQLGLESKLDALHGTMKQVVKQLDRLALGIEEIEGS